jgi:hypothetical protein
MTRGGRLARLEAALAAIPPGPCPACGLAPDRLVVLREGRPAPPGADCAACESTRQTIRVRFVIVPAPQRDPHEPGVG